MEKKITLKWRYCCENSTVYAADWEELKKSGVSMEMAQKLVEANCGYLKVGERVPAPIVYM